MFVREKQKQKCNSNNNKEEKSKIIQGNKHACMYQDIIAQVFDVRKVCNLARINRARILCIVHAVLWYAGYGQVQMNRIN